MSDVVKRVCVCVCGAYYLLQFLVVRAEAPQQGSHVEMDVGFRQA